MLRGSRRPFLNVAEIARLLALLEHLFLPALLLPYLLIALPRVACIHALSRSVIALPRIWSSAYLHVPRALWPIEREARTILAEVFYAQRVLRRMAGSAEIIEVAAAHHVQRRWR